MGKRFYIGNVADISPEIKIGKNIYYVASLQDKHLHAGEDAVEIYTSDGKKKLLNKGEWIGQVFSFVIQQDSKGVPYGRITFHPNAYFPNNRVYFLKIKNANTISESILKHNYKQLSKSTAYKNVWVILSSLFVPYDAYQSWKNGNIQPPNPLPTKEEQNTTDTERADAEQKLDTRDDWWNGLFKNAKNVIVGGVAVVGGLILLNNLTKK